MKLVIIEEENKLQNIEESNEDEYNYDELEGLDL